MIKQYLLSMIVLCFFFHGKAQEYYKRSHHPDNIPIPRAEKLKVKAPKDFSHYFYLSWDGNKPLTNKDFISDQSTYGFKAGFRKRLNDIDNWWVGIDYNWSVYKQHIPTQTYTSVGTSSSQSVTTDLFNYSYNYGLTVNMDYVILPIEKIITPYIGIAVGGAHNQYKQYYNIYNFSKNEWGLLLRPEIGALIGYKVNSPWRLKAAVHYDYSSAKSSDFDYKSFSNIGLQVGIVRMTR